MTMAMGTGTGEQGPIPEMAPGWKDGVHGAASAPWHWCPDPAQHQLCHPTAVPVPKPQGQPWFSSCTNLKHLPQPKGSQG